MAMSTKEEAADALTRDEMMGKAPSIEAVDGRTDGPPPPKKAKNAFTELMSPSKKSAAPARSDVNPHRSRTVADPQTGVCLNNLRGRDALGAYIVKPESFPSPQRVLQYDDKFVTIHDVYAKASIHLLVLPRDRRISVMHPFDALADANFLTSMRAYVAGLKKIVASELRRKFAKDSRSEAARNEALSSPDPPDKLPPGRDWEAEIKVGVHAHPSMSHMHVHIISRDMHSEAMKHRKHYNSFCTRFFVPLEDFPIADDDERRHPGRAGYLAEDLRCWRCNKNFGHKFKQLKTHLEEEFEDWKRE